jgi:type I restriction enzyme, S subunit
MNAERLLAHYGCIADAPDAVPHLRRFILDLAVRGKLVEQDPADEPASELLKQIAKEKVSQSDLPKAWRRARVSTLLNFQYGKGLKASERANEGPVPVFGSNGIVGFTDEPLTSRPSIIVGRKGSAGALNLCDGPSWTTDVAYYVEVPPFFEIRFLLNALAALDLNRLGKGVKPGLSRSDAYEQVVYVPPLAEQRRILAKMGELMALCDQLEATRAEREANRDQLTAASLARLNAPDPNTFQDDARFALDALPSLTARPDQMKQLRQTILNLAVRGKLMPQEPNDEPASVLLKRIAKEIAVYSQENGIAKARPEPIADDVAAFAVPRGWQWARLCALFRVITDGDHQPPPKTDEGVAFLTIGNITTGRLDFSGCRSVPKEYFKSLAPYRTPARGDILYTVVGATYGRPALVETDRDFCVQRHIAILKPSAAMDFRFLIWLLASPLIYNQATRSTTGTAQPTIALRPLRNFTAPVPPLAEQHRIVAKLDELMALCDRLEASLTTVDDTRRRLLEALLAESLSPALTIDREAAE